MSPAGRSTALTMALDHCPRAVDHADAGTPYDRDVFAVGIAAHAVLEGLQRAARAKDAAVLYADAEAIADQVSTRLVTEGRSFDGVPEPPLSPAAVGAGRDIALRWWLAPRDTIAVPLTWEPERAFAVDANWKPVPYSRDAYWRGILDIVGVEEQESDDEYGGGVGIVVTDYKTAWNAGASWLDSVQAKGQALLALAHAEAIGAPRPDFVRRSVVNLRTRRTDSADLYLGDDDADETLTSWRKDIALAVAHVDACGPDGRRHAAPGAGCMGCPYILRCEEGQAAHATLAADASPAAIATAYAASAATTAALAVKVKGAANKGAIAVPGGVVGYVAKEERTPTKDAHEAIAVAWFRPADETLWRVQNERLLSLLAAMKPGSGTVGNVGKALYPGRGVRKVEGFHDLRADLADRCLTTRTVSTFGIHAERVEPDDTTDLDAYDYQEDE